MNPPDIHEFSDLIRQRLEELTNEDQLGVGAQKVVELDQQSLGRLSRMDALQSQAMAQAQQRRRDGQRLALRQALRRIEEGEFGDCIDCGEAIDVVRLRANPTLLRCMSCAQG
ncbi:MAG: TraR/DksA family transcriptional regulator [Paracoccaceae bacterium]